MTAEKTIFIISGATGETASDLLQVVLAQFPMNKDRVAIERFAHVTTPEQINEIIREAVRLKALIFDSLVDKGMRISLRTACQEYQVMRVDVLGRVVDEINTYFDDEVALYQSGLIHQLDESYSQRILAMEYVVMHDDGRNVQGLRTADVVLVGISRSAKTPLSLYLATRGVLVGNVPLVPGIDPPPVLFELDIEKVIGLIVRPARLAQIRQDRIERMGVAGGNYEDLTNVRDEVKYARMLYAKAGWAMIDMTSRSIESGAEEILRRIGRF